MIDSDEKNLSQPNKNNYWLLIPLVGTGLFICCYIFAAALYPGGSQADKNSTDYSILNNYWCNLLNEKGINGLPNPGRKIALTGMVILCFSLAIAWYVFPLYLPLKRSTRLLIQANGILSMVIAVFLFTSSHDMVVNVASLFGLVAVIGTLIALYYARWQLLFSLGIFNLFMIALNNFVYHTDGLIVYLPVVQKISFISFLAWVCFISLRLYRTHLLPSASA